MNSLEKTILKAKHAYYNTNSPIMTDEEYDILITKLKNTKPNSPVLTMVGSSPKNSSKVVSLPYWLGSLNKFKKEQVSGWADVHPGPYVVTEKLDGVSALLIFNTTLQLYTRGNGNKGTNISHLLQYIKNIPKITSPMAVRGELVIKDSIFNKHFKNDFKNARNLVSGIVNKKTITSSIAEKIDFIAYELIEPPMLYDEGILYCQSLGFSTVQGIKIQKISSNLLSAILKDKKQYCKYYIDGIVITVNEYIRNTTGNPSYAFAYKEITSIVTTEVINIEWNISKDGYFKPVIYIKPVSISGAIIKKATGFNAKFIVDNKIGPGAIVEIIRSGDVIPHIHKVISPTEPQLPSREYVWTDTNVDIMLKNPNISSTVKIKRLCKFFNSYDAKGIKLKTIEKFYNNGIDSIIKFFELTIDDIIKIEGFDVVSAKNILKSINELQKELNDLPKLMAASGCYDRGLGVERFKHIIDNYPDYLVKSQAWAKDEFITKIIDLQTWQIKTAEQLYNNNKKFISFYNDIKKYIIATDSSDKKTELKYVLFTGFRDDNLKKLFESNNWEVKNSISKKIALVIKLDKDYTSNNVKKAEEYNLKIITKDEVAQYLN